MCADFLWKKAPQLPPSSPPSSPPSWPIPSQVNVISQTSPPHSNLVHPKIQIPTPGKGNECHSEGGKIPQHGTGGLPGAYPGAFTFQSPLSQPPEGHQLPDKPPLYKYLPTLPNVPFPSPLPVLDTVTSAAQTLTTKHHHTHHHTHHQDRQHTMSWHTHTIPIPLPI